MIDFKLTENSDLVLLDGDLALVEGTAEVAQTCSIRLRVRQGEWKQNVGLGINWDQLWAHDTSMAHKEMLLRKAVVNTPGVTKVKKFQLFKDPNDMTLYVEMEVETEYSEFVEKLTL